MSSCCLADDMILWLISVCISYNCYCYILTCVVPRNKPINITSTAGKNWFHRSQFLWLMIWVWLYSEATVGLHSFCTRAQLLFQMVCCFGICHRSSNMWPMVGVSRTPLYVYKESPTITECNQQSCRKMVKYHRRNSLNVTILQFCFLLVFLVIGFVDAVWERLAIEVVSWYYWDWWNFPCDWDPRR